jgi:hypothetical protein
LSWLLSFSLNSVLGALQDGQEDLLKKGTWCALMMPFASVSVVNMAVGSGGTEVAKKPQRMEAMVVVSIKVSLSMLVKATDGHINSNGLISKLSGVYKPAASIHRSKHAILNASDFNRAWRISAIYFSFKGVVFPRNGEILYFSTYHFLP